MKTVRNSGKVIQVVTACSLCLLSLATVVKAADTDINAAIEDRRANLKGVSKNIKLLSGMAKGEIDYDADKATAAAAVINENAANLQATDLWPEGSDLSATQHDGNRAKPDIWNDVSAFLAGFAELETASATLSAEAGNGLDALKANLGASGKTCKGCHQDFRGPKP